MYQYNIYAERKELVINISMCCGGLISYIKFMFRKFKNQIGPCSILSSILYNSTMIAEMMANFGSLTLCTPNDPHILYCNLGMIQH